MHALIDNHWVDGFLDHHRPPDAYRVEVVRWRELARLDELYFERPRSVRLVATYLREVGVRAVLRKISSRRAEGARNQKSLSCGLGRVIEAPEPGEQGRWAVFVAPSHPPCMERIVVPPQLMRFVEAAGGDGGEIEFLPAGDTVMPPELYALRGWSPFSGVMLEESAPAALDVAEELLAGGDWSAARRLPRAGGPPSELRGTLRPAAGRIPAVLFGYGNYAKTTALPHLERHLQLERVHEIDPMQMPQDAQGREWTTSPLPLPGARHEAYLIAGYHATHAGLAITALEQGAAAVVEKPLATTREQLDRLLGAMRRGDGRLFACFQRRHLPFHAHLQEDLGVRPGEPLDYHCVVYEVPLPAHHWYRWPSSGSRLLSNGCHWIDHFLHLNGYGAVRDMDLFVARSGVINLSIELESGALFTMVLTDHGSERIGVQDHTELRANGRAARIVNAMRYEAEGPDRVLRRDRCAKLAPYAAMYEGIGASIASGAPGDDAAHVERSTSTVLDAEDLLRETLKVPVTSA